MAIITTWATGSTIYVTKWYDQSGNGNDISQATAAQQPVLTLSAFDAVPAVTFSYANQTYLGGSFPWVAGNGAWSAQAVLLGDMTSTGWSQPVFEYGTASDSLSCDNESMSMMTELGTVNDFSMTYYGAGFDSGIATKGPAVFSEYFDGTSFVGVVNGMSFANAYSAGAITGTAFSLGGSPEEAGVWLNGSVGEFIAYPNTMKSSLGTLQSNARIYYGF